MAERSRIPDRRSQKSSSSPPKPTATPPTKDKRTVVRAACEECRRRKEKCSAERPSCRACITRDVPCVYQTATDETHTKAIKRKHAALEEKAESFNELLSLIKSMPEASALQIFQRIRAGEDTDALLKHLRAGQLLLELALRPETRYRYDFPIVKGMPTHLDQAGNPYMKSLLYEKNRLTRKNILSGSADDTNADAKFQEDHATSFAPYHAARLIDPKISSVKASRWTTVTSDDGLVHHLLERYFMYEYPMVPCLHKDLFLSDMVAGRTEFCSSILVNAILSFACQGSDRLSGQDEFWNPDTAAYRFTAEANRLLELDGDTCRVTTIQALLILGVKVARCALDLVGLSLMERAANMTKKMSLMSPSHENSSSDLAKVRLITAWGAFAWCSMWRWVMFKPPFFDAPPADPLPPRELAPELFGEVWVQYPLSERLWPLRHGLTSVAYAEVFDMANAINVYKHRIAADGQPFSNKKKDYFYSRLNNWFQDLPEPLQPQHITFPGQIILHIFYHNIVSTLARPLSQLDLEMDLFSSQAVIALDKHQHISTHAQYCLEMVVRLYYLRHGFDKLDCFLVHFLNAIGFQAVEWLKLTKINKPMNEELLSTLALCTSGLREQSRYAYIMGVVYMILCDNIDPAYIGRLGVTKKSPASDQPYAQVRAEYPVVANKIDADPTDWRVDSLLRKLEKTTFEEELVTVSAGSL